MELAKVIFLLLVPLAYSASCPDGFKYQDTFNKCYKYVGTPTSWLSAEEYCLSFGGHLVSIHSAYENSYVVSLDPKRASLWIGFNLLKSTKFAWSADEAANFTNWIVGQPQLPSYYQCAQLVSGDRTWRQHLCNSNETFVCQAAPDVVAQSGGACPSPLPVTVPICPTVTEAPSCPPARECPTLAPVMVQTFPTITAAPTCPPVKECPTQAPVTCPAVTEAPTCPPLPECPTQTPVTIPVCPTVTEPPTCPPVTECPTAPPVTEQTCPPVTEAPTCPPVPDCPTQTPVTVQACPTVTEPPTCPTCPECTTPAPVTCPACPTVTEAPTCPPVTEYPTLPPSTSAAPTRPQTTPVATTTTEQPTTSTTVKQAPPPNTTVAGPACNGAICQQKGYVLYEPTCRCYKYFSKVATYVNAIDNCIQDNAQLVKIDSADLNAWLLKMTSYDGKQPWIGLTCATTDLAYCKWADGTALGSYSNFVLDGPKGGGATATYMWDLAATDGQWETVEPTSSNTAFCEKGSMVVLG